MANSNGIVAGKAFVVLEALDKTGLGIAQAAARMKVLGIFTNSIGSKLSEIGNTIAGFGRSFLGFGAALGAPLVAATYRFSNMGNEIYLLSQRTGIGISSLLDLDYVLGKAGQTTEGFQVNMKKLASEIVSGAEGSHEAALAFRQLGLDAQKLLNLGVDDQLFKIADAMAGIRSPTERAALASQLFGRAGLNLLPFLEQGAAGIKAMIAQGHALGTIMTEEDIRAGRAFSLVLTDLKRTLDVVAARIAGALLPGAEAIADKLQKLLPQFGEWVRTHWALVSAIGATAVGLSAVGIALLALGPAIRVVGLLLQGLSAIPTVLGFITSALATFVTSASAPLLIVGAIVGGLLISFTQLGNWIGEVTVSIAKSFSTMVGDLKAWFEILAMDPQRGFEIALLFFQQKMLEFKQFWLNIWSGMVGALGGVIAAVRRTALAIHDMLTAAFRENIDKASFDAIEANVRTGQAAAIRDIKRLQAEKAKLLAQNPNADTSAIDARIAADEKAYKQLQADLVAAQHQLAGDVGGLDVNLMDVFRQGFGQGFILDPATEQQIKDIQAKLIELRKAKEELLAPGPGQLVPPALLAPKLNLPAIGNLNLPRLHQTHEVLKAADKYSMEGYHELLAIRERTEADLLKQQVGLLQTIANNTAPANGLAIVGN
jgi:hypothetical protein